MCYLEVCGVKFTPEGNPIPFPTLGHSSEQTSRSQRGQTTTTQIFCRYPLAKNINPFGGKTTRLIQHARVATLALDDDDGVGRSESFRVYYHGTSADKDKLRPFAEHQP